MADLARAMTDEEMVQAAEYFAAIRWSPRVKVIETSGDDDIFMTHIMEETNTLFVNDGTATAKDFLAGDATSPEAEAAGSDFLAKLHAALDELEPDLSQRERALLY